MPEETSLTLPESSGFHEVAKTVLKAVGDISSGVNRVASDTIVAAVKEAYMTGYKDGYRDALRRAGVPESEASAEDETPEG
ncbi:MAG: hypothetical protein GF320_21035 [Armatimonadia bacterium]|nr:hypothetical protein [Armatimonadia bacterium]